MKKIFIIVSLLAINAIILTTKSEPITTIETKNNNKLTKWEKIKTGTALFGWAFFSAAALVLPRIIAENDKVTLTFDSYKIFPRKIMTRPIEIIHQNISPLDYTTVIHLPTGYSAILAFICGFYAFKKLTSSKQDSENLSSTSLKLNKSTLIKSLLGCAFFSAAFLQHGKFDQLQQTDSNFIEHLDPSLLPSFLTAYLLNIGPLIVNTFSSQPLLNTDQVVKIAPIPSAILAYVLGSSAYKQLSQSDILSYFKPSYVLAQGKKLLQRLRFKRNS